MPTSIDLTGNQFGRLVVVRPAGLNKYGRAVFLCQCTCEQRSTKVVSRSKLVSKHTQSCGCLRRENARALGVAKRQTHCKRGHSLIPGHKCEICKAIRNRYAYINMGTEIRARRSFATLQRSRMYRSELHDAYIKNILKHRSSISAIDIKLKRQHIKLCRIRTLFNLLETAKAVKQYSQSISGSPS